MKQFLEDMKVRKPRIPLPELTDEDKEKLGERGQALAEGRAGYLLHAGRWKAAADSAAAAASRRPGSAAGARAAGGDFTRNADPAMTSIIPSRRCCS